jgi:hypothetical protein
MSQFERSVEKELFVSISISLDFQVFKYLLTIVVQAEKIELLIQRQSVY